MAEDTHIGEILVTFDGLFRVGRLMRGISALC